MTKKQINNLVDLINGRLCIIQRCIDANAEIQLKTEQTYLQGINMCLRTLNIVVETNDQNAVQFVIANNRLMYVKK